MKEPTEKIKRLCREYLIDFNGEKAGLRAGYSPKGCRSHVSQILKRPMVAAYLASLIKKQDEDLDASAARTIKELSRLAYYDIGSYYKRDHKNNFVIKDLDELTPDQRAAIAEFNPKAKTFKLHSKDPSLDRLGRHFKLFSELHEQQMNFTIMSELKLNGKPVIFNVGLPAPKK